MMVWNCLLVIVGTGCKFDKLYEQKSKNNKKLKKNRRFQASFFRRNKKIKKSEWCIFCPTFYRISEDFSDIFLKNDFIQKKISPMRLHRNRP